MQCRESTVVIISQDHSFRAVAESGSKVSYQQSQGHRSLSGHQQGRGQRSDISRVKVIGQVDSRKTFELSTKAPELVKSEK